MFGYCIVMLFVSLRFNQEDRQPFFESRLGYPISRLESKFPPSKGAANSSTLDLDVLVLVYNPGKLNE